jgi:YVTN family beta-propeller protein
VWVTNFYETTVTKLRASDGHVLGTFEVGHGPSGIAFDGQHLWIANNGSNNVVAVRPSDGAVMATVPVGKNPFGVEISTVLGITRVWVTSFGSNNVTVVDPRQVL